MIIYRATEGPTPTEPKREPLTKTASTSLTATDDARLMKVCSLFGASRASVLRAALLTHLDAIETK